MEPLHSILLSILTAGLCGLTLEQRVAPGVPPQLYQQPAPPQYHQHPPPPYQHHAPQGQVPIEHAYVTVPQQPLQKQVPQQPVNGQVPVGHVQDHGHSVIEANLASERQHIQEHIGIPMDTSQMSQNELLFHFFKMHDADNNSKLDGCEMIKYTIHAHDESSHGHGRGHASQEVKIFSDEELASEVDPILSMADKNKDGYIDYAEFVHAQAEATKQDAEKHPV